MPILVLHLTHQIMVGSGYQLNTIVTKILYGRVLQFLHLQSKLNCCNILTAGKYVFRVMKKHYITCYKYLLVQIQQWKYQNKRWNMFKVSNKDTKTTSVSMTSFWCLYFQLCADFIYCFTVSVFDFEQVNTGSDILNVVVKMLKFTIEKQNDVIEIVGTLLRHIRERA